MDLLETMVAVWGVERLSVLISVPVLSSQLSVASGELPVPGMGRAAIDILRIHFDMGRMDWMGVRSGWMGWAAGLMLLCGAPMGLAQDKMAATKDEKVV